MGEEGEREVEVTRGGDGGGSLLPGKMSGEGEVLLRGKLEGGKKRLALFCLIGPPCRSHIF